MSLRVDEGNIGKLAVTAAAHIRATLEELPSEDYPLGYDKFPSGWCGQASELLATYLNDLALGKGDAEYVIGWRDRQSHAWVEWHGQIIDITAGQFDGNRPGVWITSDYTWHAQFVRQQRSVPNVRMTLDMTSWLQRIYRQITSSE
jgi:hypothetical protein